MHPASTARTGATLLGVLESTIALDPPGTSKTHLLSLVHAVRPLSGSHSDEGLALLA